MNIYKRISIFGITVFALGSQSASASTSLQDFEVKREREGTAAAILAIEDPELPLLQTLIFHHTSIVDALHLESENQLWKEFKHLRDYRDESDQGRRPRAVSDLEHIVAAYLSSFAVGLDTAKNTIRYAAEQSASFEVAARFQGEGWTRFGAMAWDIVGDAWSSIVVTPGDDFEEDPFLDAAQIVMRDRDSIINSARAWITRCLGNVGPSYYEEPIYREGILSELYILSDLIKNGAHDRALVYQSVLDNFPAGLNYHTVRNGFANLTWSSPYGKNRYIERIEKPIDLAYSIENLISILSTQVSKRLGLKSQLKRLPKELIRLVGEMLIGT